MVRGFLEVLFPSTDFLNLSVFSILVIKLKYYFNLLKDKLVPYMTLSIFRDDPGVAGIYIAATISGTLSTVSSGINSLATCFVTDLLIPHENRLFGTKKSEKFYTSATKIISGRLLA